MVAEIVGVAANPLSGRESEFVAPSLFREYYGCGDRDATARSG
jgi:hypothetical protein